jgi:esterase/lipase superfamily enzyme
MVGIYTLGGSMRRDHQRWYSPRTGREMGVVVYGHWGPPAMVFPTSGGDEWEFERQGVVTALFDLIDSGRVKLYCVDVNHRDSFANRAAHPLHRSWMQRQYADYVRQELVPFVRDDCRDAGIGITAAGASLGAYHAINATCKFPDVFKRCLALSGVYDMKRFMDGAYDDNFYFNNPVDYLANLSDRWTLDHLASCDIHIATGSGPWENSAESYRLSGILAARGIHHHLDDWGPLGGHDWPYWKDMVREYLGRWG